MLTASSDHLNLADASARIGLANGRHGGHSNQWLNTFDGLCMLTKPCDGSFHDRVRFLRLRNTQAGVDSGCSV